ncbi:MAG: 2'-5' RNA ligase family protein [Candidatus Andeanibacterium colombiense]|uniref:2'-5' RNA ligase family protein n=1 Tax=Candidatus Andeanibacterium colombiense TaxID=3121345 RepID=A0AAJ5X712_9SPHN|nr:MAG: 2'-5' RNA ligase family protein [Sphingomonadaceae bacterium]
MAGAPLLITAELPPDVLAWADGLRRLHYPPERNRLRAHVTLFHALPPSAEGEARRLLADFSAAHPPPEARVTGLMDLGTGTAMDLRSDGMVALHAAMSERLHGVLTRQDDRRLRLHITVQNKVERRAAKTLQAQLAETLEHRRFRFRGFGLYAWESGLWNPLAEYPFRG